MSQPIFARVLRQAEEVLRREGRVALCQIVRVEGSTPGKEGWKLLIAPDRTALGNLGGGAFEALVKTDALAKLAQERPRGELKRYYFTEESVKGEPTGMVCGGMAEVFVEVMLASPLLVVCGGGPVGQAVARAGELAGFDLAVVEDREEFRRPELFPEGTTCLEVDRRYRQDFLEAFPRRDLYVAIVTRCWETDAAALGAILRQDPANLRYLGLMGSRRKIDHVKRVVRAAGLDLSQVELRAPIGLPVGGDSPGEIAIGVLAEILEQRYRVEETKPGPVAVSSTGE